MRCNFLKYDTFFPKKTVKSYQFWFLPHPYFLDNFLSNFQIFRKFNTQSKTSQTQHVLNILKCNYMRFGGHNVVLLKTTSILMMSVLIPPPPIPIRVKCYEKLLYAVWYCQVLCKIEMKGSLQSHSFGVDLAVNSAVQIKIL